MKAPGREQRAHGEAEGRRANPVEAACGRGVEEGLSQCGVDQLDERRTEHQ